MRRTVGPGRGPFHMMVKQPAQAVEPAQAPEAEAEAAMQGAEDSWHAAVGDNIAQVSAPPPSTLV